MEGQEDSVGKKLQEKSLIFDGIKGLLQEEKPHLSKLSTMLIKPKPLHLYTLLKLVVMLLDGATIASEEEWGSLRGRLDKACWDRVAAFDPRGDNSQLMAKTHTETFRGLLEGERDRDSKGVSDEEEDDDDDRR